MPRETPCQLIVLLLIGGILSTQTNPAASQDRSQQQVTGRVVDASTLEPLPNVHVFYDGTTIGDITDNDGLFILPVPHVDQVDLVVSMIGFQSEKILIDRRVFDFNDMAVSLTPLVLDLDEVVVLGILPKEWNRNRDRFKRLLFSSTRFGRHCTLENAEILDFVYDRVLDHLTATAREPLEVDNPDLGFHISIHDLLFEGSERLYRLTGRFLFTEMTPEDEAERVRWIQNRKDAYLGSMRHFLSSVAGGTMIEEGFSAYHVAQPGINRTHTPIAEMGISSLGYGSVRGIMSEGISPSTRWLSFSGALLVRYENETIDPAYARYLARYAPESVGHTGSRIGKNPYSWMTLPLASATVDTSGVIFNGVQGFPVAHFGYWAWERLGEMLPTNYVPESE